MNQPTGQDWSTVLTPAFIVELDQHMLLHYPRLWPTKFCHVLYWSLLIDIPVLLVGSAFAILAPFDKWITTFGRFAGAFWIFIAGMMLLGGLVSMVWFYSFRQYYPEREYAPFSLQEERLCLAIYFRCLLLFLTPAYLARAPVQSRMNGLAESINLEQDLAYITAVRESLGSINVSTFDNPDNLPIDGPDLDFALLRKYTLTPLDENKRPFDWSALGAAVEDAQKNADNIRVLAFGVNGWILAMAIGFLNAGLLTYMSHYFSTVDYARKDNILENTLWPLAFAVFISIMVFVPPIKFLLDQEAFVVWIAALLVWASSCYLAYFLFFMPDNSPLKGDSVTMMFVTIAFPVSVFYSVTLLFILINPNPDHLGLQLFIATLSYIPLIPNLKLKLLTFYAMPNDAS